MVMRLAEAALIAGETVLAVWRAPERLHSKRTVDRQRAAGRHCGVRRDRPDRGAPRRGRETAGLPTGRVTAPRGSEHGIHVLNVSRMPNGTVALSGPMVPHASFPPGAERGSAPKFGVSETAIETGYPCRVDAKPRCSHRRPAGGASSASAAIFRAARRAGSCRGIEDGSTLARLPDMLAGTRLAGPARSRRDLRSRWPGRQPLLVAASGRETATAASAA
jgi:hypothetical protein